jgi:hypothetical protein
MTRIEGYRFGRVVVDGEEQSRDVIVLPSRVVRNWWREEGHVLGLPDLDVPPPDVIGRRHASDHVHPGRGVKPRSSSCTADQGPE